MEKIRILLVDSQTLFREGLKALLASGETVEIAGEMAGHEDASAVAENCLPDLVLMDVARARGVSSAAAKNIARCRPSTRVVFLTARQDDDALHEYQESGASGYILKDTGYMELLAAIHTIHNGGTWVSAPVLAQMNIGSTRPRQGCLTARENEVLRLTAEGNSVKEIASMLLLSAKTVDAHKVNLMRKLRIHNKAQLVHYAFQNQILKLDFCAHP